MFETLGIENLNSSSASFYFALVLGGLFGYSAEKIKFCFRRALINDDRSQALFAWLFALAIATLGTQAVIYKGWVSFENHRFYSSEIPYLAIATGGLLFGIGMIFTRGCISRMTVLAGTGNIRALFVILIFAVTAHSTMKGPLSYPRLMLSEPTFYLGEFAGLANNSILQTVSICIMAIISLLIITRARLNLRIYVFSFIIGNLAVLGWLGTGYILYDEFEPIELESLSFTRPATDTLFWSLASTSVSAKFGAGLISGVILSAFLSSLQSKRFEIKSFETPIQTIQYITGAMLMGFGGVLAGGCTMGAGISGISTLSVSAFFAIIFIGLGAKLANRRLRLIRKLIFLERA